MQTCISTPPVVHFSSAPEKRLRRSTSRSSELRKPIAHQEPRKEEVNDDRELSALPGSLGAESSVNPLVGPLPGTKGKRSAVEVSTLDSIKSVPITKHRVESSAYTMNTLAKLVKVVAGNDEEEEGAVDIAKGRSRTQEARSISGARGCFAYHVKPKTPNRLSLES